MNMSSPARPNPISIAPYRGTVNVMFSDAMIASTKDALLLHEEGHEPVFYIPFRDIYFDLFAKSETRTKCPRKGEASYWDVRAVGEAAPDVMWAYENPMDNASAIRAHGAFDPGKVRIEAVPQEDLLHQVHAP